MKRVLFVLAMMTTPAMAQGVGPHNLPQVPSAAPAQPQPPVSVEQRLGAQIGALVIQNASLLSRIDQLEAALRTQAAAPATTKATPEAPKH